MNSASPYWFKFANYFMLAVFLFATVVQYNDPDPLQWIAIYGIAALACLLWIKGAVPRLFYLLIAAAGFTWVFLLYFSIDNIAGFQDVFGAFEMKNENVEVTREIGGLLIVSIWMTVLAYSPGDSKTTR